MCSSRERKSRNQRRTGLEHFEDDVFEIVDVGAAVVLELLARTLPLYLTQRLDAAWFICESLDVFTVLHKAGHLCMLGFFENLLLSERNGNAEIHITPETPSN